MVGITRINLLYNTNDLPARKGYRRRARKGRPGRLGVSRSTFFDNFVLHNEDNPYIPGTNVRRLKLLHLAQNASAAFNDEIDALEEGLKRWRDDKPPAERRKRVERDAEAAA